ncbi:MAG: sulfotransferase [Bacteroidetes bacterium]|nr:sulfotransferase [Bacteroidota bacterium]
MFSSIYIFNFRVFFTIIYQNLKHFSFRRLLLTPVFILLFVILFVFTLLPRLLDEIFFPNYRKKVVKDPVFIISTPRSGTTLLHRLMATDEERFTYFLLYHCFLPSVLFYKFIRMLKRMDHALGGTMKRFWDHVERVIFKGWKGIHNLGFEKSEEDEGLFVFTMNSPACGMFTPWFRSFSDLNIGDRKSARWRKSLMNFYYNTLQRFLFAWGGDKQLLVKNVMSTGRIEMILEKMPRAKVIMIMRHPYQTIPSVTSMFSKTWKVMAPDVPEDSPEFRAWGKVNMDFYRHITALRRTIPDKQLLLIQYDDLVKHPEETVLDIYGHFGWEPHTAFRAKLKEAAAASKKYEVGHHYTLEQYGYSKEEIDRELKDVFDEFGFEQTEIRKMAIPS